MKRNLLLLAATILLAALPLLTSQSESGQARFTGSDDQAEDVIKALAPAYERWAEPLWEPPSAEIESLLFAAQAALGAGLLGYVLGALRRGTGEDAPNAAENQTTPGVSERAPGGDAAGSAALRP